MAGDALQPHYDYKKFAILYVDDEERARSTFEREFSSDFRILTAPKAREGYELLEAHRDEIGLLLTDQRMPGEKGVWLLEKARLLNPRIVRFLVTAYSDHEAAIAAVNAGAIYKYISKPWEPPELRITLKRAMEFFIVQRERDHLLHEKLSTLHRLVVTDRIISMGVLAAGMGHHVRNALVAVRTFIDLAPEMLHREDLDLEALRYPNFWGDFYQKVQDKMQAIVRMLDDLEEATDQPVFQFLSEISLHEALEATRRKYEADCAEKQISIVNEIAPDLPQIWADRPKLNRFFEFLLEDELAFLPPKCTIRFSAREIKMIPDEHPALELTVQDDGPGPPANFVRCLFDPFVPRSGDPQEFGLRLLGCYFIVYHHGGEARVKTTENNGVTFQFVWPIDPKINPPESEADFLNKVMLNERLWERLLSSP
jgi:two-component system probable response regulator PhcQ